MAEHLNSEEEDLLQSALSTAFTPAPLPQQSAEPAPTIEVPPQPAAPPEPARPTLPEAADIGGQPESADTVWKEEYEAHVAEWRRQSAEQREKAEAKRAEWEAIREQERKEGKLTRQSVLSESTSGWEKLSGTGSVVVSSASAMSPSPADARDLVTGEGQGGHSKEYLESVLPGASTSTTTPPSHDKSPSHPSSEPESSKQDKWDSMTSSITSSFPSMSFPSDPHSPISSTARRDLPPHQHGHEHAHAHGHPAGHAHSHGAQHPHPHQPEAPRTATLSMFDSSLSPKTRTLALLSSVAINMLLPFVNGVMLGFGEIFAKNLVAWLGWKVPGTASAASPKESGRVASDLGLGKK